MRIIFALCGGAALTLLSWEAVRVLQSCSYKPWRGYFKIFLSCYFAVLFLCQSVAYFLVKVLPVGVTYAVYFLSALPFVFVRRKSPLKVTKRVGRLFACEIVVYFVCCYLQLGVWVTALPLVLLLCWALCLPLEVVISRHYLRRAQKKLRSSGVTVIGITGSFGKTSTKDMLVALLDDSIAPKGSCNTPLGIAAYINSTDISQAKFLVLEFGARKKGDIQYLCKLFHPQHGIVTGVCEQHLSTFKSLEKIREAKRELVESLPKDGWCVLGDESVNFFCDFACCHIAQGSTVKTTNLLLTTSGLHFALCYGKNQADISLPNITLHSARTFANCLLLAKKLGQSVEQTVKNAQRIVQSPHRMEISFNGKFFVVDDSYNANIKGVESCCKSLAKLNCFKVVVTQGIVEGGKSGAHLNYQCGKMVGEAFDVVIAVGKNSKQLTLGAREKCRNVFVCKNLTDAVKRAQAYLSRNSILLFQNDLPDVVSI